MNIVIKRYLREFGIGMTIYVIVIVWSTSLLDRTAESFWRIPIALSPVIPMVLVLGAFLRYLNGIDELQQRIHLMAIAFAAGAVGLLTFAYGFLENIGFPHLHPIWIFPTIIVLWGIGTAFFSRKYQ